MTDYHPGGKTVTDLSLGPLDTQKGIAAFIFIHLTQLEVCKSLILFYVECGEAKCRILQALRPFGPRDPRRYHPGLVPADLLACLAFLHGGGRLYQIGQSMRVIPFELSESGNVGRTADSIRWNISVPNRRSMQTFIDMFVPTKDPIVIALVSDNGTPEYFSELEKRKNIVTSHHLYYERPRCINPDLNTLFIGMPGNWYFKSFRSVRSCPQKRKVTTEPEGPET